MTIEDPLGLFLDDSAIKMDAARAMPVTVLTGFLGAGKTTLVNRILADEHGLKIAVLVNDFGEIDIDSELIVGVESGTVSLANGCVCCEVRDDLMGAIFSLLQSGVELDAIVLEASGVAEPMGIARTFTSQEFQGQIRLDGIIAVVDSEQLPAQTQDPATRDLVYGQIGLSDLVILNKIDLADRERVDEVRSFIHERLPSVRIIETVRADVPYGVLIGTSRLDTDDPQWTRDELHDHNHDHHSSFVSWVYRRSGLFNVAALETAIKRLPPSVYRIKGFLNGDDEPEHRMLLQAVGMRADVRAFDEWGDRDRNSALVVIADGDQVEREEVEALLDACLTTRS